ncbi:hypothetical protein C8T65DRAFT_699450 [Cerioporus squamosus]|nr:hypothetical protein C8T65DRAFT_699450 [Cerioporus squamosus]
MSMSRFPIVVALIEAANSATVHTGPWQGIPPAPAPSGSAGEPATASVSQATPQAATSATLAAPPFPLAPAPVDSAPGRYQPVGRSHKVSISPGYLELVKNVQAQQVGHQEDAENEMRLEKENTHNVHVAWWHQNDTEPHFFEVRVKHWPAFHPKHCPELVDAFDLKNAGFQYFNKATRSWFNGSWDGPSRNVKTCGPLRYRTQDVTRGVDMPASSNSRKRQVAEDLDSDAESSTRGFQPRTALASYHLHSFHCSTFGVGFVAVRGDTTKPCDLCAILLRVVRVRYPFEGAFGLLTPNDVSIVFGAIKALTRVIHHLITLCSVSQPCSFRHFEPGVAVLDTPEGPDDLPPQSSPRAFPDFGSDALDPFNSELAGPLPPLLPQLLEAREHTGASNSPPDIPLDPEAALFGDSALFVDAARFVDSQTSPVVPSSSLRHNAPLSHGSLLDGAARPPRGPKGFPLRYVSDMADGFATMESLQADGVTKEKAFELVFELPYKKTTVRDNHAIWKAAAAIAGKQERWVAFGRTERGEWAHFVRALRR